MDEKKNDLRGITVEISVPIKKAISDKCGQRVYKKFTERGHTVTTAARAFGIPYKSFMRKLKDLEKFTTDDVNKICDVLKLSDDEFALTFLG